MVAQPGRRQVAFVGGELEPQLAEREELKEFSTGLAWAENVEISPQGAFRNRDGLRAIGALNSDAARIFAFNASDGTAYDLVFRPGAFGAWSATALLQTVSMAGLTAGMLPEMSVAQQLDTMVVFHNDLQTRRIKSAGPTSWSTDGLPFADLPRYDYGADIHGAPYTNGVAAVWESDFDGLTDGSSVFTLTISGTDTSPITYSSTPATLASRVLAVINAVPGVGAGVTIASSVGGGGVGFSSTADIVVEITFSGADNLGDGWAVTGKVLNKSDAAITSYKIQVGYPPGEPVISADRGWPNCGCFYDQRLLVGGLKALPNAWMFSRQNDYFEFSDRYTDATGPALVPMDLPGGERIERMVNNSYLNIFTNKAEYWLADRALSKTTPPNHVQASTNGTAAGVPIVQNEGASIYCQPDGGVLNEFRYTDQYGNFVSTNISLFASHLVAGVVDLAVKRGAKAPDGKAADCNQLVLVQGDGEARLASVLRDQDITAFGRLTTASGSFIAASVNGRNETSFIVQRPDGRRLERGEAGLLLDEAMSGTFGGTPAKAITGLSRFNGREIWAIGDNNVFGPFTVSSGAIALPVAVTDWTVGSWMPPIVNTLPVSPTVAPNVVVIKKRRIHTVVLSVIDTTSLAISTNGKPLKEVTLQRYGMTADIAELDAKYTGKVKITGLTGYADEPFLTVSQLRPGLLNVRSITIEATQ